MTIASGPFDFGQALLNLKVGLKVARSGWNGKSMWIMLATDWNASFSPRNLNLPIDWKGFSPFIAMYTADKKLVPWIASQTDILAEDWNLFS